MLTGLFRRLPEARANHWRELQSEQLQHRRASAVPRRPARRSCPDRAPHVIGSLRSEPDTRKAGIVIGITQK